MLLEGVDIKSMATSAIKSSNPDFLAENVLQDLVDEITLGICFDIHRSVKTGLFPLIDVVEDETTSNGGESTPTLNASNNNSSNNSGGTAVDVFGSVITTSVGVPTLKKQPECVCPNCQRNLAASRFAPHLEKCMGMGRNSSRLASRRLATNTKETGNNEGCLDEDDAEDEDWIEPGKTLNRRKRDKNSPRRNKGYKLCINSSRNGVEQLSDGCVTPPTNYDQLSLEERGNLLSNICGVISSTSRRLCTRSTRCPIHTDAQRRELRIKWLGANHEEETHVDIDSFTEGDTVALRESLSLLSNASSPAESTISTSSNPSNSRGSSGRSSTTKGSSRRGKRGKGGSKNGSRGSTPPLME